MAQREVTTKQAKSSRRSRRRSDDLHPHSRLSSTSDDRSASRGNDPQATPSSGQLKVAEVRATSEKLPSKIEGHHRARPGTASDTKAQTGRGRMRATGIPQRRGPTAIGARRTANLELEGHTQKGTRPAPAGAPSKAKIDRSKPQASPLRLELYTFETRAASEEVAIDEEPHMKEVVARGRSSSSHQARNRAREI